MTSEIEIRIGGCDARGVIEPSPVHQNLCTQLSTLRLSPELRQRVKTLFAVRCKAIMPHPGTVLGWGCRGSGDGLWWRPTRSRNNRPELIADDASEQGA